MIKTKRKSLFLIAAALAVCLLAAFAMLMPFSASAADEETVWTDADGNTVLAQKEGELTADAKYSEKLTSAHVKFNVAPKIKEGAAVFALLRERNKLPDSNKNVRGLYFEFCLNGENTELNVKVVERASARLVLDGYKIGESVFIEICTVSGGALRLYLDGERIIADFDDVTAGFTSAAYSAANVTYAAVKIPQGSSIVLNSLTANGDSAEAKDEWIYRTSSRDFTLPSTLTESARLTAGQYPQRLEIQAAYSQDAVITFAKSSVFNMQNGAQGFKLNLTRKDGKYIAAMSFMRGKQETDLFSGYVTTVTAGERVSVTLREKLSGGFMLEIAGERVLISGKDPLGLFAAEDFSDGMGRTYIAFESDGETTVSDISGLMYDYEPIGREPTAVNTSEIGNRIQDWTDGVNVNNNGLAVISGACALKREMSVDYVGFTLDALNLVSVSAADCNISFAVSATGDAANAEITSTGANGIIVGIKNKSGIMNVAVYERYAGVLKTIIGDTALTGVNLYAPVKFEIVWYDYELKLVINGKEFVNEYGLNPLQEHYPKYYRNENKKTYLCFAQNLSAEGTLLTPDNATRFAVYGIDNMLPAEYRLTGAELKQSGQGLSALWLIVSLAASAVCACAVAAVLRFKVLNSRFCSVKTAAYNTATNNTDLKEKKDEENK